MLKLVLSSLVLFASQASLALEIRSCKEANVELTQIVEMRQYANGGIKLFVADQIEPAAASVGVAVAITRGDDLSTLEEYCRYVWGLSGADLTRATSSYDRHTNVLTVKVPVRSFSDEKGDYAAGVMTLKIDKGAKEADLVKAELK